MKKIIALVVVVAFLAVGAVAFATPVGPKGDLKITKADGKHKKPAVVYNHEKHSAATPDCKTCHHTWDGKDAPKKCSECHTAKKDGKKLSSKDALHKNCKGCHKTMKKAGKKTGPTSCKKCHKK
ncbi:MAG: cytochrome c3 family protein [Deltaproteobacteria bacterium]|nr:cytochrome c3 family protein [Candidatus Tharpella sp.]